ncbi:MAG: hypothetical protein WCK02_00250 [Bacteroidota bacterium]
MKEIIIILIVCGLIFGIFKSCKSSDKEKDEKEANECVKEKSENEKYKSIEEAIASYDFVVARKYLNCYKNAGYDNNGDYDNRYSGRKIKDDSYYLEYKNSNPYLVNQEKITQAEFAYLIQNGETVRAKSVAKENDMMELYIDAIPDIVNKLIEKKDYDNIFNIITTWTFKYTFSENRPPFYEYDKRYSSNDAQANTFYNEEVQLYNNLIDNILKSAIINNDDISAKKCLSLYAPIAVLDPKTKNEDSFNQKSILQNPARDAAIRKITESGMKIN